jgi:hypothetical protein
MKQEISFSGEAGSASIEFIFLGLLAPLLVLSAGLTGLGTQRQQVLCQIFSWQAVRQIAEHTDETSDQILSRLNSLAIAKEASMRLEPGELKFQVEGFKSEGQVVTVRTQIRNASASSSIRIR